jgi:hypothetical protein
LFPILEIFAGWKKLQSLVNSVSGQMSGKRPGSGSICGTGVGSLICLLWTGVFHLRPLDPFGFRPRSLHHAHGRYPLRRGLHGRLGALFDLVDRLVCGDLPLRPSLVERSVAGRSAYPKSWPVHAIEVVETPLRL